MDALRRDDLREARETPPGEKLRQALVLMQDGIALHRATLRMRHPACSDDEIRSLLDRWLARE